MKKINFLLGKNFSILVDVGSHHGGYILNIKRKFNILKIGHAGTLDPGAEGILPIAIGKTTKLISFINDKIKNWRLQHANK